MASGSKRKNHENFGTAGVGNLFLSCKNLKKTNKPCRNMSNNSHMETGMKMEKV